MIVDYKRTFTHVNPPLDETLEHHGVKGMHWGVRRAQAARAGAATVKSAKDSVNVAKTTVNELKPANFKRQANTHRVGVNTVHTKKVQKFVDQSNRVAEGKGSLKDKAGVVARSSVYTLARNDLNLKTVATKQANRGQAHIDRINSGHAKVLDNLHKYGSLTLLDIAKANRQVSN